jgi:hypothetical protein
MMVGMRPWRARLGAELVHSSVSRSRGLFGWCTLFAVSACSLVNSFDDVKPAASGAAGAGMATGTSASTSSGTQTSGDTGSGGASATGSSGTGGSAGDGSATSAVTGAGGRTVGTGGSGGVGGTIGTGGSSISMPVDGGSDAPADAPADVPPPRLLTCRFVIGTPMGGHRMLDDFSTVTSGERTLDDKFFMTPLGNGSSVRILAQRRNQPSYLEYFASDSPNNQPGQPIPSNGRMVDAHRIDMASSATLILQTLMGFPPQLMLHRFDDSMNGSMPTVSPLTNPGDLGSSGQIDARFSPAPDGTIAVAMSYVSATTGMTAGFGLYSGAVMRIIPLFSDMTNEDAVRPSAVSRVRPNNASYAFYGGQGGQTTQVEYEIKDGARTILDTNIRRFGGPEFVLAADVNAAGSFNVVMANVGTLMNPTLKLLLGQFDRSQAMTFSPSSLAVGKSATSIVDIPIGGMSGLGDDLLYLVGPTGATRRELSLLVVDVWGRTRAEQKLKDTLGEVGNAAIVPRGTGGVISKYHIVWSETRLDMNGKYDVVLYDQLECL